MTQPQRDRREPERSPVGSSPLPAFALPLFAIALGTALAAGVVGHFLAGNAGLAGAAVVALFGAVIAAVVGARTPEPASSEREPNSHRTELEHERHASAAAAREVEKMRRQIESAVSVIRSGRDPLTEVAELRVGPLRELLEAAKEGGSGTPVVSRLPLGEEELIGADGEALPEPWPVGIDDPSPLDPRVRAEARRGLDELIDGLAGVGAAIRRHAAAQSAVGHTGAGRTPAQLVDAVVQTAADGIEDLAAGLMRANELAGVAERVTNKATLLALNAALEATRSGSEAFASIAEETRRLAEFAREATDTISRLSSEIEYKVGETITAIHATSEDAKSAVLSLAGSPGVPVPSPVPAVSIAQVEALLERARNIRATLGSLGGAAPSGAAPAEQPHESSETHPKPEVEVVEAVEPEAAFEPGSGPVDKGEANPHVMLLEGLSPGSKLED